MHALHTFLLRLRSVFRKASVEQDLDAELRAHLDLLTEENIRRGMSPEEARYAAKRQFGGVEQIKETLRARRGLPFVETFLQDIRFGLRMLAKNPGFTGVAVLTLALGIGANTAIFTVVKAVLLRPLPFRDPERLVSVRETVGRNREPAPVAYPNFVDWRARNHVFEEMAAYSDSEFILNGHDRAERVFGEAVDDSYFPLLGVAALHGRTFSPEENRVPMKHAVALIGHGLWQRAYGSDTAVIGKTLRLNNFDYTIVGVLPKGFLGFSDQAEVWIPMMMRDAAWPQTAQFDFLHNRDIHFHKVLARLRPGISLEAARAEMAAIGASLAQVYPKDDGERGATVFPAKEGYTRAFRTPLLILLGAVGFVLLIACANVANLLLTRGASRQREIAVRLALGARPGRLVRQFITENLMLSTAGAVAGTVIAAQGLGFLLRVLPLSFPSFVRISLDSGVFSVTSALTVGIAVVLGFFPTLCCPAAGVGESLKEGAKGSSASFGQGIGRWLVVSEVALALVLMIGAGLLLKSFLRMMTADPGFRPDHLLTLRFYVPDRYAAGDARNRLGPELAEKISALAGVESAAVTFIDPFLWGGFQRGFSVEGHAPISNAEADSVYYQEVGPDYFRTMGIPIRQGRDFTMRDSLMAPHVIMVSEAFAKRYWPKQNAVGKRVKYGPADSPYPWMEVIGVAGDIKYNSLRQDPQAEPVFYGALLQSEVIINMSLIVRTRPAPEAMIGALRDAIQRIDPAIPVYNIATLDQRMREDSAETRSYALLLALFAALAVALAGVGVYGVLNYSVTRRTRELGIRLALGATPGDVRGLVIREAGRLALAGVAIGVAGALLLTRAMTSLLFEVRPFDPAVFFLLASALAILVVFACYAPARRAMRVDPVVALRYE